MAATGTLIRVPVAVACRVLGLSPQGYYKWLRPPVSDRDWADAHLIDVLYDLHADDATLGYRFLTDELADECGIRAGENRVHRLCQIAGITASHHRKKGKSGRAGSAPHEDLLAVVDRHGVIRHEFAATKPNQVWLWDISEHPTRRQAPPLRDQGRPLEPDRRVLDRRSDEVQPRRHRDAQRDRVAVPGRHDLPVRPRGSVPGEEGAPPPQAPRPGRIDGASLRAGDNASMESFFALLQKNGLNTRRWDSREELRLAIVTWIEMKYNRRCRQRALGKHDPQRGVIATTPDRQPDSGQTRLLQAGVLCVAESSGEPSRLGERAPGQRRRRSPRRPDVQVSVHRRRPPRGLPASVRAARVAAVLDAAALVSARQAVPAGWASGVVECDQHTVPDGKSGDSVESPLLWLWWGQLVWVSWWVSVGWGQLVGVRWRPVMVVGAPVRGVWTRVRS